MILIHLLFIQFISSAQTTVVASPNSNCTGESKKCEYSGPSILINEINISPSNQDGSLVTGSEFGSPNWGEGEWIELYNPDECNEIDISGYMLGSYNSLGQRGAGGGGANGMGFILPQGSVVPPNGFVIVRGKRATPPPPEVIDIVAIELANNICIEGGPTSRFWFANSGGWFAFYDRNGVVQDAIKWGAPVAADLNGLPCISAANVFPSSVTSVASYNSSGIGHNLGSSQVGWTYVRIPDGGNWSNTMAAESSSYGSCNLPGSCDNGLGSSTCNGSATLTPSFGTSPYTYAWDDALEQTTVTATQLCAGTYQVSVTDAVGIKRTVQVIVVDDFFEIDSIKIDQPNCFEELGSAEIMVDGQSISNGTLKYTWDPAVSTSNVATSLQHGYYKVSVNDDYCLRDTFFTILDREIKISTFVDQPIACLEKEVNFQNFSTGVAEGTSTCYWDFGDGESSSNCSPSHLYKNVGNYDVTLKITDQFGCEKENTSFAMVNVNTLPVVDLGNDTIYCGNEMTLLDAGPGFVNYEWSNGAGGVQTISAFPYGPQSVVVTDINGCKGSDTIVLSALPYPAFELGDDQTFCEGETTVLNVPLTQVDYLWNTGTTGASITISESGVYYVEVVNAGNCYASDSMELFVIPYPTDASINKDTLGCVGDQEQLRILTDGDQVLWSNGVYGNSTLVTESGNYSAIASNNLHDVSCSLFDTIDVVFQDYPELLPPDSFLYCFEFDANLKINTPTIANYYNWRPEENYTYQRTSGPHELVVYEKGVYSVSVFDHPFCRKIQEVVVEEKCPLRLYVPTAFTPDNDGVNDLFYPVAPNFEILEFTIFNRWGEIIFESIGGKGWNGQLNGNDAQQGIYVWKCRAKGYSDKYYDQTIYQIGTVALVR